MTTPSRSGVFEQGTDPRVEQFTESISFDKRLYAHEIQLDIAHAQMLHKVGILDGMECEQLIQALGKIQTRIEQGRFEFTSAEEDIHMHVEQALIRRLDDTGRKLHTARSRNDQVATAFRMWVRDAIDRIDGLCLELQRAFLARCDLDEGVILPGYTHLQRAQPVLAAHYWLAYVEKLERDRQRLRDCRSRVNIMPLGSAAIAGTTLPIDREDVANRLGFERLAANSMDATSDRDFVIETAFCLVMVAEHLSSWAEEWILWSTIEFDFLQLPQQYCTGSSIMPQKINPDVLELTRGKTARVIGALQTLLVLVKGLPLAYNRDMQEDKPPLFDAVDTVEACLAMAAAIVSGARLKTESIAARLDQGFLDATTLMEYLIRRGLPQRKAHHLVGALVRQAMSANVRLADLPLSAFQALQGDLDATVYDVLGVENAIRAFVSYGSTAPQEVARQVERWKQQIGSLHFV